MLFVCNLSYAENGKELYLEYCSACHGFAGGGGVGVPLNLPSFINAVDDNFLKKTIKYGRPGRVMESFDFLSEQQISSIVKFISRWRTKKPPIFDTKNIRADIKNGKELYDLKCHKCHGKNGEGAQGTGVAFSRKIDQPILAPALNNRGFLKSASDEMIKKAIMEGRFSTPMKSFIKQGFSEQDINDIVNYIRTWEKNEIKNNNIKAENIPAVLQVESESNFDNTVKMVEDAIIGANFVRIRTTTFESGFVKNPNKKQVVIHFCNFKLLYDALAADPRVGLFLPCSITITEENNKVFLSAGNPKTLSQFFNNNELEYLCDKMTKIYETILEDSSL